MADQTYRVDEIRSFIESLDDTRKLVALLAYAGLTAKEVCNLRPEDAVLFPARLPGADASKGLTAREGTELLRAVTDAPQRDRLIVTLAMVCALRQIELRRLTRRDVWTHDGRTMMEVTGKGGKKRTVFVPSPVDSDLIDYLENNPKPFDLSESGMWRVISKYLGTVAPEASPHALRHSMLTWLLNSGATLEEAMEIAGHSEVSSHEVYAAANTGWFLREWQRTHPISEWTSGVGYGHIYVWGKPRGRKTARGTERVVPVPLEVVRLAQRVLGVESIDTKKVSNLFRSHRLGAAELRKQGAIHATEAGAHPFLVSLLVGVRPDTVVQHNYSRRGRMAEDERVRATESALANVLTRDREALDGESISA